MASWDTAQAALDEGDWRRARDQFSALAQESGDPGAYDRAAQAAWWLDDADTCLEARERAYRRFRELGDDSSSAAAAATLAYDSVLFGSGLSIGLGWLSRADALLERLDESSAHGWCEIRRAELALHAQHDTDLGRAAAERASAVAVRTGHDDLQIVALGLHGLALTQAGDIDEGMTRLDAAVAAATAGDLTDVMWMGKVCCWLIAACEQTRDLGRAADWCRRVEAVSQERGLVPLFESCRILYASVQVSRGSWAEAEQELTDAMGRLSGSRRTARLNAVVQLGELRRRQGRCAEADTLYAQAEFDPIAIAGRAQIKMARGDIDSAWSDLSGLLRSLPDDNVLTRAPFLLPAVRAALARGDEEAARIALEELRRSATTMRTDALFGLVAVAEAAFVPAGDAVPLLREAVRRFAMAGLRYDESEGRVALAEALLAIGETSAAHEQLQAVIPALAELSAAAGLAKAQALLASQDEGPAGPLTAREVEVIRLVARGLSNREIAEELVVSEHTVHRHMSNIFDGLGQHSRASAVAAAISLGVLPAG